MAWVGLGWVWFALDVGNSSLSFNFFETNLMHVSPPWMGGRQLQHQLRTFYKYHYVCLGVLYGGEATPATASNFFKTVLMHYVMIFTIYSYTDSGKMFF